ncbi:MAG TPA: beta-N-acetylglucosaminidase domain-containing protein [Edaphobacter sp.]|nr:beta-N-acetylglucosaminidase domain-containing protein [Edaphobacter sp.]
MKRRTFVSGVGMIALTETLAWGRKRVSSPGFLDTASRKNQSTEAELRPFEVRLPHHVEPLPFGSSDSHARPSFLFRGTKGWAWSPEQYLAEIPIMAKYRLNFLMNCYSSFWDLGPHGAWVSTRPMNFWYRPLSAEQKEKFGEVIRSCQQRNIIFCLSMNPNLRSDRPFDYSRSEDLEALWQHYAWAQSLGVKWFNVSLDDITRNINAEGQATLVNQIFERLRRHDSDAQMTFCPTWYAGTGEDGVETKTTLGAPSTPNGETPGSLYLKTLGKKLHPDVYLFWTGPKVEPPTINVEQATRYKALCGHRLFLWDNYPVNNQSPALDLGPLRGRSADLCTVIHGYMANSMGYENEANRLPLLTIADYTWNSGKYDPDRSIGQSILHLADTSDKREALKSFVELYPGRLWDGASGGGWNSLRVRFDQLLRRRENGKAHTLLNKAQTTLTQMQKFFPDPWSSGSRVLDLDLKAMRDQLNSLSSGSTTDKRYSA